jgi:hypothetical protein
MSITLHKKKQEQQQEQQQQAGLGQLQPSAGYVAEVPDEREFERLRLESMKPKPGRKKKRGPYFPDGLLKRAADRDTEVWRSIIHGPVPKGVMDFEPDFTNPEGTKWWFDKSTSEWGWKYNMNGTNLPTHGVWEVLTADGRRSLLIVDHESNGIVKECNSRVDAALFLDMLKFLKDCDEAEKQEKKRRRHDRKQQQ